VKEAGGRRSRYRLVTAQAALSVLTLVLAGLFAKNSVAAADSSPGFRIKNLLLMTFDPSMTGHTQEQTEDFYRQIQERVRALPGVRQATLGSHVQLSESYDAAVFYRDGENLGDIPFNRAEPGFFDTMATPIVRGRALDDHDTEHSPRVVVVNETLARRWFGGDDALGRRIRLYAENGPEAQIVGIARDGKYEDLYEPPSPYVYIPYAQDFQARMTLFVWTAGDPAAMTAPIREQVTAIAPNVVMFDVRTMQNVFDGLGLIKVRLSAQMTGAMGLMGLALTMLGLHAVMAFLVNRKTREIGIRMALGATRGEVQRQVLRTGLSSTLWGVGIGVGAALVLVHYLPTFFRYVSLEDPEIFLGVPVFLLLIALAACWAPARRASRIDPAVTLRYE
jgi:predicted permease